MAPPFPAIGSTLTGVVIAVDLERQVFDAEFHGEWADLLGGSRSFPIALVPRDHRPSLSEGEKFLFIVEGIGRPATDLRFCLHFSPTESAIARDRPNVSQRDFEEGDPPLTVAQMADAINNGDLRREIDEALGWDPELAV